MTIERKTTSIAIDKDLWRKLKIESMEREVTISSIIEGLLIERYRDSSKGGIKDRESPPKRKKGRFRAGNNTKA